MSRRDQIKLSEAELLELMASERIAVVSSLGPRGWPHSMPLWFVPREGEVWIWTYAKSQKVRNLERDPRATLQVEAGLEYAELRGVMLRCDTEIHRDVDVVVDFAMELVARYSGTGPEHDGARDAFRAQAPKRVALEFAERDRVTWDHRKLAGTY
jgi:PPOX class probable F420-dependent enzyme